MEHFSNFVGPRGSSLNRPAGGNAASSPCHRRCYLALTGIADGIRGVALSMEEAYNKAAAAAKDAIKPAVDVRGADRSCHA